MKLVELKEVFEVVYPKTLASSSLEKDSFGINFVSSSGRNNGVSTRVKERI